MSQYTDPSGLPERVTSSENLWFSERICAGSAPPATAARDTRWLVEHGYKAEEVQPVDLFPRTKHVECVVKLVKIIN